MRHGISLVATGLATSAFLAITFVLCVARDLAFSHHAMYEAWIKLLPGFEWISWSSFFVGLTRQMSHVNRYLGMSPFFAAQPLRGSRLRGIAWIVLASWLFTLSVCVVNSWTNDHIQNRSPEAVVYSHLDNHSEHDNGTQQDDACCNVLENLSIPSQANNPLLSAYALIYVILPCIAVFQLMFFTGTEIRFHDAAPPGKPDHTLIANSLWPNAPPR